jgi:hypothetical protein
MLFKKEYRALGLIVLPLGIFRVFITVVLFPLSLWLIILPLIRWLENISLIGYSFNIGTSIDWYFVNITQIHLFAIIGLLLSFAVLWIGRELINDKRKFTVDIIYMLFMYTFIAPLWLIKSSYNALLSKKSSWR